MSDLFRLELFTNATLGRLGKMIFETCPVPINGGNIPVRKIFIPNSDGLTKYKLKQIFSPFGEIHEIVKPGKSKYAFITFLKPEDAAELTKKKSIIHDGRKIYINAADQWHQPIELPDGTMQWVRGENSTKNNSEIKSEEMEVNEVVQADDATPLCLIETLLNDDCLLQIFHYLSLKQLIGIERVCKRWRAVSLSIWHKLQKLDFTVTFPMGNAKLHTDYFRELLLRSGSSITTLDLSGKKNEVSPHRVLQLIGKHCHNLTSLNISGIFIKQLGMKTLIDNPAFCNLKCLYMEKCNFLTDMIVTSICEKAVNLEELSLADCSPCSTDGLKKLPPTLTFLDITNVVCDENEIIPTMQKLTKLNKLHVSRFLSFKTFCLLGKTLVTLKASSIYQKGVISRPDTDNSDGPIFPLLTTLDLSCCSDLDDNFLANLVSECPALEKLDLSHCSTSEVTSKGLNHLAKLRKLTALNLSCSPVVKSDFVSYLAANTKGRLRFLSFRKCGNLDDSGPLQVLSLCNELCHLDLRWVHSISEAVLVAAIECLKLRTNKIPLKLLVAGTMITKDIEFEPLPLLNLDCGTEWGESDDSDDDEDDDDDHDILDDIAWEVQSMFDYEFDLFGDGDNWPTDDENDVDSPGDDHFDDCDWYEGNASEDDINWF